MAFDNNQKDSALPVGTGSSRTALDFLPKYFRTPANQKFLNATIDQLINEGTVGKVNAYVGRRDTPVYKVGDRYLEEVSTDRQAYQFEPAIVSKDTLDNVTFFKDYNDYMNQLNYFAGTTLDHNKSNKEEYYAWNPHIDWDKFVNYREYYWLPNGPQPITILGQSIDIESTYTVKTIDEVDNVAYLFTPDGLTANPSFKLYRGQTYNFAIDCESRPFAFKTVRSTGNADIYTSGITLFDESGTQLTSATQHLAKGTIKFTVPYNAPNVLYYASETDINTSGFFNVYDIDDTTHIDVDAEIVGKKSYITSGNISLSNGMKLTFAGKVTPEKYATSNWYVEGVGTAIRLIAEKDLETPAPYTSDVEIEFDNENFDTSGFDVSNNYPGTKDYITINRSSLNRNPWSRHNRWFHRGVIETAAIANNQPAVIDQAARAKRPIIEFEPNILLWNSGKVSKTNVTVVDTFTTDVFSTVEGSYGYNVDYVDLVEGMRVLFTADTDIRVAGRIFTVQFITHLGERRITLIPTDDTEPQEGESVLVTEGTTYRGSMFHYVDGVWTLSQSKTAVNQAPLFDVVDPSGVSYGNKITYPGTTFAGTKIFSYLPGTTYDTELGFNINYRNVGNFGDIVFTFNLHTDVNTYQSDTSTVTNIELELGYLRIINSLDSYIHANGWIKSALPSTQYVVRQYDIDQVRNMFLIDAYNNSGLLTDLQVKVYVNGLRKYETDYTITVISNRAYVQFFKDLNLDDVLIIKTISSAPKVNGYYEFPFNLENNPQNLSLDTFTLGEVNNHVASIADNLTGFRGVVPGTVSLRDFGNITALGTKVVQHSAPLLPIAYHITNKKYNVINALRVARLEYAKFKRNLLRKAVDYGYDGTTRIHLDLLLKEVTKDFTKINPYYLSDTIPCGASFIFDQEVIDNSIVEYPLIFNFNLATSSERAVLIYVNEVQLVHGRDYVFTDDNFVKILSPITAGDNLKIVQYEKTDGCYLPPTPSKFGLYPAFEPKIYIDTTYQTPTKVIQGHDGSITVAFSKAGEPDEFRDKLLLEFEKRIFNNIKVAYNPDLFDLYDFIPGLNRTTDLTMPELNSVMAGDFLHWSTLIADDYTKQPFFNINNPKTYNYSKFKTEAGNELPGFWRGIFKFLYDTDRPHTHPWEMLGFSNKPSWWESVYGPAPYTSDNLILWKDLSDGLIKEPGKKVIKNNKFVRPNLLTTVPVDEYGNLNAPTDLNIISGFSMSLIEGEYAFGDHAPIESAWRKSSEYPFSLITALTILRPAKVFATCFDRVRQYRDDTGQIVYKVDNGNLRFNVQNLMIPSTPDDNTRVFSAGLVNYVVDYIIGKQSLIEVDVYKNELNNLLARMSSKLAGFTTKEKFKLILDSRNPLNKGNVFVPEENYNIILNTSSPVAAIDYSAVIIEKEPSGFVIRGYNKVLPAFKYFRALVTNQDAGINVGGISESYIVWASNQYFNKDRVVFHDNSYYRVVVSHQASSTFEPKYFVKLPRLPLTGGRDIVLRTRFDTSEVLSLHYGAELKTVQDVVDFLLGYEEYLKSVGLIFENFNPVVKSVTDFRVSAKEFAFWTTQNWSEGSVISLSPCAEEIKFSRNYSVVDSLQDNFYEYSILKQDGAALNSLYTNNIREGNIFTLQPKNTSDGIYHATLNLVQKEHVLILDNITIFNDVIYDQVQGYRQDRIKVVGYKTTNWQGGFDIPGFIYDQAVVKFWHPWTDYRLGDTVKYKEFYYSARENTTGTETFNFDCWNKLDARPQAKLIPNWDYRANQFPDFYDLDTDSFDLDQQKFAQHLVGYQKRQYLENIINDDVSQYKFYQGFIREKGTENSFAKLFDPLSTSAGDSLEFYEEWAVRVGQYGATSGFDEVEFRLDETQFLINPQPVELTKRVPENSLDFVYRILPDEVYLKNQTYNHAPFPTKKLSKYYVATAGYVNPADVEIHLNTRAEILTTSISSLQDGYYFWIGYDKNTWNVYRFTLFENQIKEATLVGNTVRITLERNIDTDIVAGSYIGINNTNPTVTGFHEVTKVGFNYFEFAKPLALNVAGNIGKNVELYKFVSVRIPTIEKINNLGIPRKKQGDIVWVDNDDNNWEVWKYQNNYSLDSLTADKNYFGKTIVVDSRNSVLVTSTADSVEYYARPTAKTSWIYKDELSSVTTQNSVTPNPTFLITNGSFGQSMAIRSDSLYLAIGAPAANVSRLVVGSTSATGNRLTLSAGTTANFIVGGPIVFVNNELGGIRTGVTYYVKQIVSTTVFTISETPNGDEVVLETRSGSMTVYANHGYVVLYSRNNNGYYETSNIVTSTLVKNNQFFGQKVALVGNKLFITTKGSATVAPSLSVFSVSALVAGSLDPTFVSSSALIDTINFTLGLEIIDLAVAENGNVVISFNNNLVKIWNFSNNYNFNCFVQDLTPGTTIGNDASFGSTVDISANGQKLAIGAPTYSSTHPNEGGVRILYNKPDKFSQWTVTLPNLTTYSTTQLTIQQGILSLYIRQGGTGLVLRTSALSGVVQPNPLIVNGGTGYLVNDIVYIVGGDGNATYKITQVTNGVVTAGIILTKGTNYGSNLTASTQPKELPIVDLQRVTIEYNKANYMVGVVESYDNVTAKLTVNIKEAYTPGTYYVEDFITHPYNRGSEYFGSTVKFNTVGDQLAISLAGGRQRLTNTFDTNKTTFDLDSTSFGSYEFGSGAVMLYDQYENKFIFSDSLDVGDAVGSNYGSVLAMSDRVYIGDYNILTGAVHEFYSTNKSWYKFREPTTSVDINKIKSVFLYDIEENNIVSYLDVIDPLQGKILGVAEEELKFKTHYDPATYTQGNDSVVVDTLMPWKEQQVGHLWWDLSSAKFLDANQGSILYKANTWNNIFLDDLVDVYEWVESYHKPSEWDKLADTEIGLTQGVSGTSKYGDAVYSTSKTYDTVGKAFKTVYYFWVKNKVTVPDVVGRKVSAKDIANYISNPKNMGVSYIAFHGADQFSLVNCKQLIAGKKIAVNIRYWLIDNFEQTNIHSHYQLLSNATIDKPINAYIEKKWIDSLCGFDSLGNDVPDPRVPAKLKYGIQNRPRQSMFVNRVEALKEFIERVNSVLVKNSIIDEYDLTDLNSKDAAPSLGSGKYDYEVSTYSQIRFVGTNDIVRAVLTPVIENGKIVRVTITVSGKGYVNPPEVIINGTGTGARISTILGTNGQVIAAVVEQSGSGYSDSTTLTVRTLSVLVVSDETANNKWSLYSWNAIQKSWFREVTQTYDTTRYWKYIDWYDTGYNEFTKVEHVLDFAYELPSANIAIGDIVKVKNQGIGGWVLLEKIDNQDVIETTVNYKTIGRQNGTIKFTDNLYKFAANSLGFDGASFDSYVFDDQPKQELRIILETIKNKIFINEFETDYKDLFFASIRYAFTEQKFVDWAFKTSFVRSKHNLGLLEQKPTYQNDNLASYQEYIDEAKPYRSKVREFVSTYESVDPTHSQIGDFDLPPRYNRSENVVKTFQTQISDGLLSYDSEEIKNYPYSDWLYSVGFNLTSIEIVDGGSGYVTAPQVIITPSPGSISATAYLSAGTVTKIIVTDPFKENFLVTPTITLVGSVADGGREGRAVAILSNSLVRSTKIGIKFDRVSPTYTFNSLEVTETFTGSGSRTRFELAWPIDIVKTRTSVSDNTGEFLGTDYIVTNEIDTSYSYKRYKGVLTFHAAPSNLSKITINYYKDISLLDAADRINFFYNPGPGQLGSDLGQLMQGVDYGGVEITGIGFDVGSGWDALPWFTTGYDTFDPDFTDKLIRSDGVTRSFTLDYAPTEIEYVNVYWSGSRVITNTTAPTGTGNQNSTTLVVSSANGIKKGQTVSGIGIQPNTVVSDISGVKITLTKALSLAAAGVYTFRSNETFNKRLDDPNYTEVKPLLDSLASLRTQYASVQSNLNTAQENKDFNIALVASIAKQAEKVYDQRAAALANGATQEVIDALTAEYTSLLQQGVAAEQARDAAIALLASGNATLAALKGTRTITPVQIFDIFGRLIVPANTYLKGQSVVITGTLSHGSIDGYVSGTTYYVGEVINNTSIRITGTYDDAIRTNPVFTVQTTAGVITPGATVTIKGKIETVEHEISLYPSIINTDAVMNSFIGNGESTGPIVIPNSVPIQTGDTIILRKNTSDGSFKPSDIAYDTQIFGGDFAYVSATGIAAEDINIDGDGFVTPYTSHAPEEVVTGQVVDTVDITVYHKISDGSPVIETKQYKTDAVNMFDIGQRPGTSSSVIVKVNGNIIKQGVDYQVNYYTNQIELITPYPDGLEVVITSLSQNGLNILDLDYFVADGTSTEFISVARWSGEVTAFVTVNGEPATITTFKTDTSYSLVGNVGIRFDTEPTAGSIINYTILGSAVDSISKVQKQTIIHDGTTDTYDLTRDPEFVKPLGDSVLVVNNSTGELLRPSDTVYFIVSGNSRTYYVDSSRYAFNTIDSKVVTVTINGQSIVQGIDYFWIPVNNQLKVKKGVAKSGDKIALSINLNSDYTIASTDTGTQLQLSGTYSAGTVLTVVTFSNHDILEIEREHDTTSSASILVPGFVEYYRFNQLAGGRIKLRRPAIATQYTWITLNRKLLTPDVDYTLEDNMNYISFSPTLIFNSTDIIDVIAFSSKTTRSSFGYKIFKDMLNKNSYTRIDDSASTSLASPLKFYDSGISVVDASLLPEPSARLNKPGVIFINGERIEYYRKDGNVLRQVKRGTLGTGVKAEYDVGTLVRDQSVIQSVPYKDEFISNVIVSDGYSTASTVYPNSTALTVSSIIFEGEDQTADITGNQLVTVTGNGFKINVKVFVGDVECIVTRISETKLTFITPAKSVGAYDLVIYNPAITTTSNTVISPNYTGTILFEQGVSTPLITTVELTSGTTSNLRVGLTLNKVSGAGAFGGTTVITEINSSTKFTIKSTSAYTQGNIVFTATSKVITVTVPGTVTTSGLTSTVTLTESYTDAITKQSVRYTTEGFKVGQIVSKVSGTATIGTLAIISEIVDLFTFKVTAVSTNAAGSLIFNINNQVPTSRVISGGVKYLRIPLDFSLNSPEPSNSWYRATDTFAVTNSKFTIGKTYTIASIGTTDFTLLGAAGNQTGLKFVATAAGTGTGTVTEYLSIPSSYNQCNDVEIFVAGRRLRKNPYQQWNPSLGPDSPSGDVQYEAEFSISAGNTSQLRLTTVPDAGQYIVVQKRVGRVWSRDGVSLSESGSDQAKFIRATYALLPDKNKV